MSWVVVELGLWQFRHFWRIQTPPHGFSNARIWILDFFVFRTPYTIECYQNHNSTQPNITLSWVRHENDFAYHPTPPHHHTNSMLAISQLLLTRFWWNFKCRFMGTSRTDSMVTFVQATFVQVTFAHNSTSAISQLLLTRFWWNFKRRFLWASRTV